MPTRRREGSQRRHEPLAILAYVADYQQRNAGRSPSQRRIQRALGLSAPSVVHYLIQRLIRAGLLTSIMYGRGRAAELLLTDAGRAALAQRQSGSPGGEGRAAARLQSTCQNR